MYSGEKLFECEVCKVKFRNISTLNAHKGIHSNETFQCNVCDYKLKSVNAQQRHQLQHSNVKLFNCEF